MALAIHSGETRRAMLRRQAAERARARYGDKPSVRHYLCSACGHEYEARLDCQECPQCARSADRA